MATETNYLGRGGKTKIERLTGVSHNTINRGVAELSTGLVAKPNEKIRKEGGGRKKSITPQIWDKIEAFIEPHKRGEPESPLLWISKSLRNIEAALKKDGAKVSYRIIGDELKKKGTACKPTVRLMRAKDIRTGMHSLSLSTER